MSMLCDILADVPAPFPLPDWRDFARGMQAVLGQGVMEEFG
jgi:hypothetical protein